MTPKRAAEFADKIMQPHKDHDLASLRGFVEALILAACAEERAGVDDAVEQLRVQLASCSVAASGNAAGNNDSKPGDYGHSVAYMDVKKSRAERDAFAEKFTAAEFIGKAISRARELRDQTHPGRAMLDRFRALETIARDLLTGIDADDLLASSVSGGTVDAAERMRAAIKEQPPWRGKAGQIPTPESEPNTDFA